MATSPVFFATPVIGLAQVSTANTALDGTGDMSDVLTGAAGGTRVDEVRVKATVSTTDGMVRLFIYDGTSVTRLIDEVPISAKTIGASTESDETIVVFDNLVLPENYVLKASTHNAEAINVIAFGASA